MKKIFFYALPVICALTKASQVQKVKSQDEVNVADITTVEKRYPAETGLELYVAKLRNGGSLTASHILEGPQKGQISCWKIVKRGLFRLPVPIDEKYYEVLQKLHAAQESGK